MPRVQGMIQRLEQYTSKLTDSDDKKILRLRQGKIRKGAYKGSRKGRFKYWLAKPFLSKEQKEKRTQYLHNVATKESMALARELCADISRRTPVPYEVERKVTVEDVKAVLETSREDREKFSRTVREFVSSSATSSRLRNNPMDAARKRLEQAMMDRTIRHHDQIRQLHREAIEILNKQKKTRKSRRKPLVEGGAPLELKHFKKLKRQLNSVIEEKMLSLALFREAEEYALKEQLEEPGATPQKTVSDQRRLELLQDFVESGKPEKASRKSIALLAAQHMLQNGVEVDEADIPKVGKEVPPDIREKELKALKNEVSRLRERNIKWANQVADLLEQHRFKEARVVEDLARDSQAMGFLGDVREAFADDASDKHLRKQRKRIKKGKKLKTQHHSQKKVRSRGPSLRKVRPQTYLDKIRPWRGNHTRVATTHAKQMIERPGSYDGNAQSKDAIIEQTLGMMQAKYRELAQDHNAFQLQELRDYLEKNICDRRVTMVEPAVRIIRPLDDIPPDTAPASSEEESDDFTYPSAPVVFEDTDSPQFDITKLETASVTSSDSGGAFDIANEEDLEDEAFEQTASATAQDLLTDLVTTEEEKMRAKSVSDIDDLEEKAAPPKPRTVSYSDIMKPFPTPPPIDDDTEN